MGGGAVKLTQKATNIVVDAVEHGGACFPCHVDFFLQLELDSAGLLGAEFVILYMQVIFFSKVSNTGRHAWKTPA